VLTNTISPFAAGSAVAVVAGVVAVAPGPCLQAAMLPATNKPNVIFAKIEALFLIIFSLSNGRF
jgi:hypothetical protein